MLSSREWYKICISQPEISLDAVCLVRLRIGCYWTAKRLADCRLIEERFKTTTCPMCNNSTGKVETPYHMIFECSRWNEYRNDIQGLLSKVKQEAQR